MSVDREYELYFAMGRYVIAVGRLEFLARRLICKLTGLEEDTRQDEYYKLCETSGAPLITEVSKAIRKFADDQLRADLSSEIGHMHRFLRNRHMAIHGSWSAGDDGLICFVKIKGELAIRHKLSWEDAEDAVRDAERLTNAFQNAIDSITHPSSAPK